MREQHKDKETLPSMTLQTTWEEMHVKPFGAHFNTKLHSIDWQHNSTLETSKIYVK